MRVFTIEDLDVEDRTKLTYWYAIDEKLKNFANQANMGTFQLIFGEDNGERLWMHYVTKCNREYNIFKTYLTGDELNILLINVLKNSIMYAM